MSGDAMWDRRTLLGAIGAAGASLAALNEAGVPAQAATVEPAVSNVHFGRHALKIVDLTHRLTREFNFDPAHPRIALESVDGSGVKVGMKMHQIALIEHTGTHIDAPSHFGEQFRSLGDIPLADLVVPLAVVDISAKAALSRNAQVEPADIAAWEKRHGVLPKGCCVAMHSGWDPIAEMARNRREGAHASTGFSPEAAQMLMEKRSVKGIAVDAMTIDAGPNVPAYPVHQAWLRSGRWGIEGMTNLKAVPATGALLVVGAAPVADATGFPVRAIAMF
ncbi:MAG: DNA-directed polymerase [Pseudomonadota bacterium]